MDKIYVNTKRTEILLEVPGDDLTGATLGISVLKPEATEEEVWPATLYTDENGKQWVRHITVAGDLDVPGKYRVQPDIVFPGDDPWTGPGETAEFIVFERKK